MTDPIVTFDLSDPEGNAAQPDAAAEKQTSGNVDPEAIAEIVARQTRSILDAWNKEQQGLRKKKSDKITQEANALIGALGPDVTDEQKRAVRERIQERIEEEFPSSDEPPRQESKGGPTSKKQVEAAEVVDAAIKDIMEEYGVQVYKDDLKDKVFDRTNPAQFIRAVREVAKAKAQGEFIPPKGRLPVSGGITTAAPDATNYISEMHAAKGKPQELAAVKEKFRKQGLQVDTIKLY